MMFPWGQSLFKKQMEGFTNGMNTKDIDQYVQQILSSTMGNSFPDFMKGNDFFKQAQQGNKTGPTTSMGGTSSRMETHVFETLDECIIQVKIPDKSMLQSLRVYHTPHTCILEGYEGENEFREEISLPCSVKRKGTKAIYRSGVLEIKMPKYTNIPLSQVDVHDFD
ncbi:Hsp20/alpha crystallin family protein [Priestia koreensis]|nr:Hsp20/alpha crystallin family protein [Priestia koreensis]